MSEFVLYDNDAALKLSAYNLWSRVAATSEFWPPAILSVARYSLQTQAKSAARCSDRKRLIAVIEGFIERATIVEPTSAELALAAGLEEQARDASVMLDSGESQLVAVMLTREAETLVTGDKRALRALHAMSIAGLEGMIFCLEQVMLVILALGESEEIRMAVCREKLVDKAIGTAFSCGSAAAPGRDATMGLSSYIASARSTSGGLLGTTAVDRR